MNLGIGHRQQARCVVDGDEESDQKIVTEEPIEPAAPQGLDRLQVDYVDLMIAGPQARHLESDIRNPLDLDLSRPGPVDVRLFPWREAQLPRGASIDVVGPRPGVAGGPQSAGRSRGPPSRPPCLPWTGSWAPSTRARSP